MQRLKTLWLRICCLLLTALVLSSPLTALADYDPEHPELLTEDDLTGASCILIEQTTGKVIFEKDADRLMYPASTTKIMTVLLGILATEDPSELVTVSYNGSKAGVKAQLDENSSLLGLIEGALLLFLAVWAARRLGVSFEKEMFAQAHILRVFTTYTPLSVLSFLQ